MKPKRFKETILTYLTPCTSLKGNIFILKGFSSMVFYFYLILIFKNCVNLDIDNKGSLS
jgi:hypothetical protein